MGIQNLPLYLIFNDHSNRYLQNDVGGVFYKADYFDKNVDSQGLCWGYPCPMAIKIYNKNFNDGKFNGYYVSYFPFKRKYISFC